MKIISKFKDYYDHFSNIHGTDDKIVYLRQDGKAKETCVKVDKSNIKVVIGQQNKLINSNTYYFQYLVVCGKLYLLTSAYPQTFPNLPYTFKLITNDEFKHVRSRVFSKSWINQLKEEDLIGYQDDFLIELSKIVGLPVFTYKVIFNYDDEVKGLPNGAKIDSNKVYLKINETCPNLSEMGLTKHYPADQLYQDISYFISNILNESADTNPPVELGDDCKIVKHGFDLKKSFRHRK